MLGVRLLGEFRIDEDGRELRFRAPEKALALLVHLVLRRDPVDRSRLAEALWPDRDIEDARAELRRHVYYLTTRALPEGVAWFVGDKRTVGWNHAAPAEIDALLFESLAASDPVAALARYGGDLLPSLDDPWIDQQRTRLRALAIDLAASLATTASEPAPALRHAERLAEIDPWNEEAVRVIVGARVALGDAGGAAAAYRAFARRLADELGVEPSAETRAAYERAIRPPARAVGARVNAFVGRERELREVAALLDEASIVTLVGPGGVGKTRLTQELVRSGVGATAQRVAFARLAAIEDPAIVPGAVAAALGVREEFETELVDAIVHAFARTDLLLVVDNCEHVLDEVAALLESLAARLPRARFLATSREPLRIEGEFVYRVVPLERDAAIALFTERARAAGASDATAPDVQPAIAAICTRLDGLPLAIELAAGQSYDERIVALASRIAGDATLTAPRRTAEPRQRSLRAMLDWSVDRLASDVQAAYAAIGAIAGPFSRRTADAVCASPAPLDELVAKSLVAADGDGFTMLETTRAHARHRLEADFDADAVRGRNLDHALVLAREAQHAFQHALRPAWYRGYLMELDNLRALIEWGLGHRRTRLRAIALVAELDVFWWDASLAVEGGRWTERALEALPPDAPHALVARTWLAAAWVRPEGNGRIEAAQRALDLADALPDDVQRARAYGAYAYSAQYIDTLRDTMSKALVEARFYAERGDAAHVLALVTHLQGDVLMRALRFDEGHATYEDAVRRYRALGDERGVAMVLGNIAEGQFVRGETADALRNGLAVLATMRALGERNFSLIVMANVAMYALAAGDVDTAQAHCVEGLTTALDTERPMETAIYVGIAAKLAATRGEDELAALLLGLTDRLYRDHRFLRDVTETRLYEELTAALRARLGGGRLDQLRAEGERMTPAEALVRTRSGVPRG